MEKINQWTKRMNKKKDAISGIASSDSDNVPNSDVERRNLKQKLIRLIRKSKVPPSEAIACDEELKTAFDSVSNEEEIKELFDESDIGNWSDSGPEIDDISISSTPKPSLKPYFSTLTLEGQSSGPSETNNGTHELIDPNSWRHRLQDAPSDTSHHPTIAGFHPHMISVPDKIDVNKANRDQAFCRQH